MVNFNSPEVLVASYQVFMSVSQVSIGAYIWEAVSSVGFEWSLLTGKRAFKWPMLIYFYCKWMLVFAFIGMLIALNIKSEINCQALYNFNQFAGNSSLGASSTLLMLRSIAIWQRNRYVTIGFLIVGAGLWGVQMHGVTTVRATWDHTQNTCSVDSVTGPYLTLVYLYTMFTDLVVLLVTLAGLSWSPGRSGLWRMLWEQGIMFFLVAFVANLLPAVMLLVNLNPVINLMFSIPAIAANATCACRCFVGLSEYARRGDEMSAALQTTPNAGGWTHRIQGPMKGTMPGTVQMTRNQQMSYSGGATKNGVEPGPTDTIDVILRSMNNGPRNQRYDLDFGSFDDDIRMGDISPTQYKKRSSDETLDFGPLDTSPAALVVDSRRPSEPISLALDLPRRASDHNIVTAPAMTRRPSAPVIQAQATAHDSRRPSAAEFDIAQMRHRGRGDDAV